MGPPRSRIAVMLAVLTLVVIALAGPAPAHVAFAPAPPAHDATVDIVTPVDHKPSDARAHGLVDTPSAAGSAEARGLPWMLTVAALIGGVLMCRRPRRVLVFALVMVLGLFAYETGLHSMHHGLDPDARRCPVAAAALHVGGVVADAMPTGAVSLPQVPVAIQTATAALPSSCLNPDQGRAPPSET
ncbi:MAG TPA: hypothetical protein VMS64_19025 [Candidatus Methylomirabilis sp.]|nr:hypothetical protein [Candidatus Methylomirabilis sp.]